VEIDLLDILVGEGKSMEQGAGGVYFSLAEFKRRLLRVISFFCDMNSRARISSAGFVR
jgi:hypothetical protein